MAAIAKHGTASITAALDGLDQWSQGVLVRNRGGADLFVTTSTRYGVAPVTAVAGGDDTLVVPAGQSRVIPTPDYNPGENDQDAPTQLSIIAASGTVAYTIERL